jgi:hypothetical protein
MDRRSYLASAGAVATVPLAGCAFDIPVNDAVTDTVTESYDVSGETVVSVTNRNGSVTVEPASGDRLAVSADRRAGSRAGLDSVSLDIVEGERFVVAVRYAASSDYSLRRADLTVSLPSGVQIDQTNTVNGDVTVEDVPGDAVARTNNGDISLDGVDGFVRATTNNGSVTTRGTTGIAGLRATNGPVDADLLAMDGDVDCQTSNGPVTVSVGDGVAARARLSTNNGSASVSGLPFEASADRRGYIEGRIRGGTDPLLSLGTNNGDVRLQSR